MSYIISEMGLGQPPFTVHRTGSRHAPLWAAACEDCGHRTLSYRLLSDVLRAVHDHHAAHLLRIWEERVEAEEIARETARKAAAA